MKMKQLQEYKISDPNDRYLRQKKLVDESLSQSKIFKDWKISPSDKPANVKVHILTPPAILDKTGKIVAHEKFSRSQISLS
jgi:hypothetical protein